MKIRRTSFSFGLVAAAAMAAAAPSWAQQFVGQQFEVFRAGGYVPSQGSTLPSPAQGGGMTCMSLECQQRTPVQTAPVRQTGLPAASAQQPVSSPKAVATSNASCPPGMVQLPVSLPGACVPETSAYVTSGRYGQDLRAAQQQLPEQIRQSAAVQTSQGQTIPVGPLANPQSAAVTSSVLNPATAAAASASSVVSDARVGPVVGPVIQPAPRPSASNSASVGGGSSYSGPGRVETGTIDNGQGGTTNYAFVRGDTSSTNPRYRVGDYYLGGNESLPSSRDSTSTSYAQGEHLGQISVPMQLGNGTPVDCTYDVIAIDGVAGASADAKGSCKLADGRTFDSTGVVYRNYDGSWQFFAGLGSGDPGNPFESIQARGAVDVTTGGVPVTIKKQNLAIGGGQGQADVINPYGMNGGVTDVREVVASNGDRCTLAVNPWSSDSQTIGASCTTASGRTYFLEGHSYQNGPNDLIAPNKTYYEFNGVGADGQYVRLVGTYDDKTGQMTDLSGRNVALVRDMPDPGKTVAPVAQAVPAPVSQPSISQVAPSMPEPQVMASAAPAAAAAAAPAMVDNMRPTEAVAERVSAATGKPVCAADETLLGSGFWDDPYTCVKAVRMADGG